MRHFSKKAILIEPNRFHQETLPSITYLLNEMGYFVEVYTVKKTHINNSFNGFKHIYCGKHSIEGPFFWLDKLRKFKNYDLIIWNSIEPEKWLEEAKSQNIPTICIIHSASLLQSKSEYQSFFSSPHRSPLVLAEHIGTPQEDRPEEIPWIFPITPSSTIRNYPKKKPLTSPIQLCTDGHLIFEHRDYAGLIEAVYTLHQAAIGDFEVNIIGNSNTVDGTLMQNQLEQLKIKHLFKFHHQILPFSQMYEEFSQMHFILPLINWEGDINTKSYFFERGSFAFPLAIQFKMLPIAHRRLAACYQWGKSILPYNYHELAEGMTQALQMTQEDYEERHHHLDSIRHRYITHNLAQIESIITKITS